MMLAILVGAAIGAAIGFISQSSTRANSRIPTWWRGAASGAGVGFLYYVLIGGSDSASMNKSTRDVRHITEGRFEAEVTQAATPVLVDFYATWCGPCKALAPVVDEVAGQFAGRIKFVKINVDESPALTQRFGIQAVPTLLFFKQGKVVDTLVGSTSAGALKARLESLAATGGGLPAQSR